MDKKMENISSLGLKLRRRKNFEIHRLIPLLDQKKGRRVVKISQLRVLGGSVSQKQKGGYEKKGNKVNQKRLTRCRSDKSGCLAVEKVQGKGCFQLGEIGKTGGSCNELGGGGKGTKKCKLKSLKTWKNFGM